jgi:hypothetical protein
MLCVNPKRHGVTSTGKVDLPSGDIVFAASPAFELTHRNTGEGCRRVRHKLRAIKSFMISFVPA